MAVLRRLPEFGVSLLPAQLTSLPDKHLLLQRILFGRHTYAAAAAAAASGGSGGSDGWAGSSVVPWRRLGDVLELAALLGLGSEDEQNEVSTGGRWQEPSGSSSWACSMRLWAYTCVALLLSKRRAGSRPAVCHITLLNSWYKAVHACEPPCDN